MDRSSINLNKSNDEINFVILLKSFKRRKDLIIIIFSALFFLNLFYVSYKRIFKPTYTGKFSILIQKPQIASGEGGSISTRESILGEIFGADTSSDIDKPTLFELLKSNIVLNKISEKYNIENKKFSNMISINEGRNSIKQRTKGIIYVNINIDNNKDTGKQILEDLKQTYLDYSLSQKKDTLKNALNLLNERYAITLENFNKENDKLANFRRSNNIFDPNTEAVEIKNKASLLKIKLIN